MAAHQAPPSLGFSRQEHWSGLPLSSPMHEGEKWKWSRSVVSDSSWPHGLQPSSLLRPWEFPGKSSGAGCHCLLFRIHFILCCCSHLLIWFANLSGVTMPYIYRENLNHLWNFFFSRLWMPGTYHTSIKSASPDILWFSKSSQKGLWRILLYWHLLLCG